jgi:hypothetical protein
VLQVLLGTRRLKVSPALPLAKVLTQEISTFKVKVNIAPGTESFEAWRERDHDDLVLAVALACWFSEQHGTFEAPTPIDNPPRRTLAERVAAGHGSAYQRIAARVGRAW